MTDSAGAFTEADWAPSTTIADGTSSMTEYTFNPAIQTYSASNGATTTLTTL